VSPHWLLNSLLDTGGSQNRARRSGQAAREAQRRRSRPGRLRDVLLQRKRARVGHHCHHRAAAGDGPRRPESVTTRADLRAPLEWPAGGRSTRSSRALDRLTDALEHFLFFWGHLAKSEDAA
jgi:hypothetical protein